MIKKFFKAESLVGLFLVIILAATTGLLYHSNKLGKVEDEKIYNLTALGTSVVYGKMIATAPTVKVKKVRRMSDGALCITVVENDKRTCIKLESYELAEAEVQ